jgi:hypothetical protein
MMGGAVDLHLVAGDLLPGRPRRQNVLREIQWSA